RTVEIVEQDRNPEDAARIVAAAGARDEVLRLDRAQLPPSLNDVAGDRSDVELGTDVNFLVLVIEAVRDVALVLAEEVRRRSRTLVVIPGVPHDRRDDSARKERDLDVEDVPNPAVRMLPREDSLVEQGVGEGRKSAVEIGAAVAQLQIVRPRKAHT